MSALAEWFSEEARKIARRYDARNGTDSYRQQMDELPELLGLAVE